MVYIMQGCSGSGKTDWLLEQKIDSDGICSTDSFFVNDEGKYEFDKEKLSRYHEYCLKRFIWLCTHGRDVIAVDNTNTTALEIAPYYAVAKAFGYPVTLVRVFTSIETAVARSVHGVPRDVIAEQWIRMRDFKYAIPTYWEFADIVLVANGGTDLVLR